MKQVLFITTLLCSFFVQSQILDPIDWEFETVKINETEFELKFIAILDDEWALYSQEIEDGGPIPTAFTFEENDTYQRIGVVEESDENKVTKNDPIFDMVVSKFFKKATFTQRVKIIGDQALIKGSILYQVCDDKQCLMPTDVPFEFKYEYPT